MAMTGSGMAAAVIAAVDAEDPRQPGETMAQYRLRIETARGDAIVAYIAANAVVTVVVTSVSGVTPGVGASGAGTGTGTIS